MNPTIVNAWVALLLAVPVLLAGEWLVRRVRVLSRFNIPSPVVGGLLLSLLLLAFNAAGWLEAKFATQVGSRFWAWLVTPETLLAETKLVDVHRPFLVAFFTCIGLNASWSLVKRGSVPVLIFLLLATVLAVFQNIIGIGVAKLLGVSPVLGVVCGSVTLTGGHGTAIGFADVLEKAGLVNAKVLGVAAATFGLVAGGLIGGVIGGGLIRRFNLKTSAAPDTHLEAGDTREAGILTELRALAGFGIGLLTHGLLLLACVKLGAWVSYFIQKTGATFPIYMGAMILGVVTRNTFEALGRPWIRTEIVDTLGSVALGIFLAIAMMSLNLAELAHAAVPMLVILAVQVTVMGLFAWFVTFHFMGRDYDAAVMAGGHCGFGLGATSNAVASMKVLVEKFGPAPRAFLVVPIVGAFLIDLTNAANITFFLNLLK